jgi:RNA polymerase sigma factor (sigma-70 family)
MKESPSVAEANADSGLLAQAQNYLISREDGVPPNLELEETWNRFYAHYDRKLRAFAYKCGATQEETVDCAQEVWRELLVRLPTFQLDARRGQFDSWLYCIVRSKATNLRRSRKRFQHHRPHNVLQFISDKRPDPGQTMADSELLALAWEQLQKNLSELSLQVLQLRLVEQRPVAEVARRLGITNQQVWYRYHRARKEMEEIGAILADRGRRPELAGAPEEIIPNNRKSAQANGASAVSGGVHPRALVRHGDNCVDYFIQKLELGRRELSPEWKVEWNHDAFPRPVLFIRKAALVAYAEMCGSAEYIQANWPRIVNAAISAGVAAGIVTIITTPTAALPVFASEFAKQFRAKGSGVQDERIQVALSARMEPGGPWSECKDSM